MGGQARANPDGHRNACHPYLEHFDVDGKYIEKSSDTRYRVGERLVVRETDVLLLVQLVENLGQGLTAGRS